jgi:hypothetical protein
MFRSIFDVVATNCFSTTAFSRDKKRSLEENVVTATLLRIPEQICVVIYHPYYCCICSLLVDVMLHNYLDSSVDSFQYSHRFAKEQQGVAKHCNKT